MKKTLYIWMLLFAAMMTPQTFAVSDSFNFEGVLTDSGGNPITASSTVVFQVLNPTGTCILYSESQTIVPGADGSFSTMVGTAVGHANRDANDSSNLMADVFGASASVNGKLVSNGSACSYTTVSSDTRKMRVVVNGTALSPFYDLSGVPMAKVAENAEKVGGVAASSILKANVGQNVDQTNLENIFTGVGYSNLLALVNGTSGLYQKLIPTSSVNMNNQIIQGVANPASATDATNKQYVDGKVAGKTASALSGISVGDAGKVMSWDGTQWTAVTPSAVDSSKLPLAGGTMTGAIDMASQNILNAGHISMMPGSTLHLGNFTNASESSLVGGLAGGDNGKIWYNTDVSELKMWNGSSAVVVGGAGGLAGGDLTGSYPNPTIAAGSINSAKLAPGAVDSAAIASGAIYATHINSGTITPNKLNFNSFGPNQIVMTDPTTGFSLVPKTDCLNGEVLKWNGINWACASDSTGAGGTVSSISVGTGLTGGPITTTGTIGIAAGGVGSVELASNAVVAAKINTDAVTSAKILDGTIASADIAASAITANAINTDAVTSAKILDGTIATADLATNAVTDVKINDVSISKITNGGGLYLKYMPNGAPCADGNSLSWDNANTRWVCAAVAGGTVTSITAGAGLTGGTITTTGAIGIAAAGVQLSHLANDSVDGSKIVDGSIAAVDIGAGVINDSKISGMLASKIQSGAGSYLTYQPNGTSCTAGQGLQWNGSQWICSAMPLGDFKSDGSMPMSAPLRALGSNAASPGIQFSNDTDTGIYSVNPGELSFSTNGIPRLHLDPSGNVGIGTNSPAHPLHIAGNLSSSFSTVIQNAGSGSTAFTSVVLKNNIPNMLNVGITSSGFIGAANMSPDGAFVDSNGTGGLSLSASLGSGSIKFFAGNNSVERMRISNNGSVGIGTTNPDMSSVLDLSSNNKGFLPPRMTTIQRDSIPAPAAGLIVFNISTNLLNQWNGTAWEELMSSNKVQKILNLSTSFTSVNVGASAASAVAVGSANYGDVASCTPNSAPAVPFIHSCYVSAPGQVTIVVMNAGGSTQTPPNLWNVVIHK